MYVAWMDQDGECHVSKDAEGEFYKPVASFDNMQTALYVARSLNAPEPPQLFTHQNEALS